ncbi:MAG: tRNA pseudouridine(38-40) synthase TruA [Anaerolineaceae bacterium]|nr:tRNA pseudouridine(38-40) synthase TruA [Anaerolineaceae bacterium]
MDPVLYKGILSYNGTEFAGFQRQTNTRTVQSELEEALRQLGWNDKSISAAGRTDAGVHAKGQVVSFRLSWDHSEGDLVRALNYYLPQDMAITSVEVAEDDFHPRYRATWRRYRYHVICQPVRDPIREKFAWRVWPEVDLEQMNQAAQDLIGSHDFAAFGSPTSDSGVTVREVFSAVWRQTDDEYQFDITANAFLYHMVRRTTMALVTVGQGEAPVSLIADALKSGKMPMNGLAPAQGLVLEEVSYT